ncbi:DUF6919 domain-containing protein [Kitasatospora griseola]|uniref:DUF6919 domain-containing protein n=1 Tax=Kitasatospora griseola TaxID=2064 RepID=UPI0034289F27
MRWHLTMNRADRKAWRGATDLAGLGELTAQWLEGTRRSRPGYVPGYGPDPETTDTPGLVRALALANRAGFVTEASQPGTDGPDSRQDWWAQRASVSGFVADPQVLTRLSMVAEQYGLLCITHHPDSADPAHPHGVVATVVNGQEHTWFGAWMEPETVRLVWKGTGPLAVAAAGRAWQVSLIAPRSGPTRAVTGALFEAFADPAQARCVRCGCTEDDACQGGCWWVPGAAMEDVCSACAPDHFEEMAAGIGDGVAVGYPAGRDPGPIPPHPRFPAAGPDRDPITSNPEESSR